MNLSDVNMRRWKRGLLRATITGGAGSVSSTTTATLMDPEHFSPAKSLAHFFTLLGVTFVASAATHMFQYLAANPLPDNDSNPPIPGPQNQFNKTGSTMAPTSDKFKE